MPSVVPPHVSMPCHSDAYPTPTPTELSYNVTKWTQWRKGELPATDMSPDPKGLDEANPAKPSLLPTSPAFLPFSGARYGHCIQSLSVADATAWLDKLHLTPATQGPHCMKYKDFCTYCGQQAKWIPHTPEGFCSPCPANALSSGVAITLRGQDYGPHNIYPGDTRCSFCGATIPPQGFTTPCPAHIKIPGDAPKGTMLDPSHWHSMTPAAEPSTLPQEYPIPSTPLSDMAALCSHLMTQNTQAGAAYCANILSPDAPARPVDPQVPIVAITYQHLSGARSKDLHDLPTDQASAGPSAPQ